MCHAVFYTKPGSGLVPGAAGAQKNSKHFRTVETFGCASFLTQTDLLPLLHGAHVSSLKVFYDYAMIAFEICSKLGAAQKVALLTLALGAYPSTGSRKHR